MDDNFLSYLFWPIEELDMIYIAKLSVWMTTSSHTCYLYILYTWLLCSVMCVPAADFCREIHHGNLNNGSLPIRLLSCIYSSCYRPHFSYFVKEVNSFLNFHRIYINTGILFQPSNTLILHRFLKTKL